MRLLKKLIAVASLLALGFAGGSFLGFALGYVITGDEYRNPHGGLILVGLLMIDAATVGLIAGAVTGYRVVRRAT